MIDDVNIGSIWRKWDLHVHTPESVLNNGFGSDWDEYVKNLFKALITNDIAVVGITDYFTIDGYKKIKEEYLSNDTKLASLFSTDEIEKIKKIQIIPNIEFRSNIFVGEESVNFHILFSEDISPKDIEERFLHEIHFVYQGEPQLEESKRVLTEANLIELGTRLKSEHSEFLGNEIHTGMLNAVVDDKEITKILVDKKNTFGGKYLFVVMADEDLSKISWNSRDHLTRKVLIQKSDLLFTSNEKTKQWGLGKDPYKDGAEKFIKEFKTLKPCIHGSDAHEIKFVAHPCASRSDPLHDCSTNPELCDLKYCWIKADPTFEGLKQVLYEPEDRVVIQPTDPTPIKSSQSIVEFEIPEILLDRELKIKGVSIPFNKGLIAVTGGKGGGKTALVDLIANSYEDRVNCDDKNSFVRRTFEGDEFKDLNTTIKFQSGDSFSKEAKDGTFLEGETIVYVAQGELEKHVEDPNHLESYINNLIFNSNKIKDSELLFDYENINDEIVDVSEKIHSSNKIIFELEAETNSKIEDEINLETKRLTTELKDVETKVLVIEKSLSPEKIKDAENKQKTLTDLREKKVELTNFGIAIKGIIRFINESLPLANSEIEKVNQFAAKLDFKIKFETIEYKDADKLQELITKARESIRVVIGKIEKFQKTIDEKEKGVKDHAKLLDTKKQFEKGIEENEIKLKSLQSKKALLKIEEAKRLTLFEELLLKRIEQKNKYIKIIEYFSANKNDILSDLEFTAELKYDKDRFLKTMSELVDLRKIQIYEIDQTASDLDFFSNPMTDLSKSPTIAKAKSIAATTMPTLLDKIVPNQKKAEVVNRQSIYDSVFGDYLSVIPSVTYKKVRLTKLSMGQKATVLIKIYLAQGENPIIIDSHDDHLDNEFIMDELVKALRQAKQHRQVIIVSNNGNVVVNSDAEQVIMASRNNQGEISYVAGSLENPKLRSKLLSVLEGGEEAFGKRQKKYRLQH